MGRLEGRVALVTGGGSGIGAAIGRRFAGEGAAVVLADLNLEAAKTVSRECEAASHGGGALEVDVTDSASVRAMFAEFSRGHSRLDVLVNNAGIGIYGKRAHAFTDVMAKQAVELASVGEVRTHWDATMELSDAEWDWMIRTHLYGTFYCAREALKIMVRQAGDLSAGKIINMGSIMGTAGGAGVIDYCAAKGGILAFTRSLARELVSRKIQVNALAPGFIETPLLADAAGALDLIRAATPQGRIGQVDDVAWAAVYLASAESDFLTGQVISMNGGWHMSQ